MHLRLQPLAPTLKSARRPRHCSNTAFSTARAGSGQHHTRKHNTSHLMWNPHLQIHSTCWGEDCVMSSRHQWGQSPTNRIITLAATTGASSNSPSAFSTKAARFLYATLRCVPKQIRRQHHAVTQPLRARTTETRQHPAAAQAHRPLLTRLDASVRAPMSSSPRPGRDSASRARETTWLELSGDDDVLFKLQSRRSSCTPTRRSSPAACRGLRRPRRQKRRRAPSR